MKKSLYTAPIAVLGAGSYGTSLAIALSQQGEKTYLWGHSPHKIQKMQHERKNQEFLPDIPFPDNLILESNLEKVLNNVKDILIVVPSHVFNDVLLQIKPFIQDDHRIMWATKGLEHNTGRLLHCVVNEVLGEDHALAVLSGPTFAKELAAGLPTAISLASTDIQFAEEMQQRIHCSKAFRVYLNDDMVAVQLGGAIKNVIAIGAGLSDGLGFGANARTALITRGIAEISQLCVALGGNPTSLMGMAGIGDLMLTCTDNQSRNRRFGLMVGQGKSVDEAMNEIGQVVEGYYNTREAYLLAQQHNIEMPIVEQLYQMLFCGQDTKAHIRKGVAMLLGRERKVESFKQIKK
ncbi:NAD(P)H-dependent glycerol-3-phosphate dehydrogenase [Pasteurella skyensis]|uniref:Glycerol-3-phosphate dehydrogenase [NAD(P)+] n=1 Tax=Phocoenobacter skyensis TaxID=97481 RepID=A0AAJ6N867_9PAST|nr:NAD(P)H-dependent glycerol-3-phosphate dehydrogenase [Pasteurella skyensis]MDP8161829.1 NAD(P)H-dependent glycerol-3-phosphate dehydrogenase [Pasteurella skyensis]MDP8171985.1 NAD(P)H-dependent glycerol-3-phosphate dehydrogenase [Pasteurella skyensis]MDP8176220.1 NAD(P)H-dependent glycerol-3-phosphate dehydrogenase [Pasteurella skyensis]MDP8178240.1 NAD(P)H-dependent glycerol-3-phosphate dehydrogenase [Pasteurella skyensis]MDP8182152.1 NAD(P)H-dependent glycerol-3-phosphate dehydrogenase [P